MIESLLDGKLLGEGAGAIILTILGGKLWRRSKVSSASQRLAEIEATSKSLSSRILMQEARLQAQDRALREREEALSLLRQDLAEASIEFTGLVDRVHRNEVITISLRSEIRDGLAEIREDFARLGNTINRAMSRIVKQQQLNQNSQAEDNSSGVGSGGS